MSSLASSLGVMAIVGLSRLADHDARRVPRAMLIGGTCGASVAVAAKIGHATLVLPAWAGVWTSVGRRWRSLPH